MSYQLGVSLHYADAASLVVVFDLSQSYTLRFYENELVLETEAGSFLLASPRPPLWRLRGSKIVMLQGLAVESGHRCILLSLVLPQISRKPLTTMTGDWSLGMLPVILSPSA